jgi:hypothetical protein
VKSGQVRSGQVKSGQVRSSQVKSGKNDRFWLTLLYTPRVTTTAKRPLIRTSYEDVDPLLYSKGSKVVTGVLREVVRQAPPSSQ